MGNSPFATKLLPDWKEKMIITKLQGGLGNQMFQYALGRHLSIKNNAPLKLDLTALQEDIPGITKRTYGLSPFSIQASFATEEEIVRLKKYRFKRGKMWFWYNRLIADRSRYVWEKQFNFEPWILSLKDPVYLDGYWNTEKYFKEIESVVRKEFALKKELGSASKKLLSEMSATESVSLHVRRSDYVSDPKTSAWHGVCSIEYYERAIKRIAEVVANPRFFVFSDDPAWAKENIVPKFPTIYMPANAEHPEEDMYLMSRCKHHIIANSTFSWWGAWLNTNPSKIVIAPKKWFQTPKMDTRDLVPDTWITL